MAEESAAQRICRRVLSTAHSLDAGASVTSVARLQDDNDSTLVRIKAGSGVNPSILADTLARGVAARVRGRGRKLRERHARGAGRGPVLVDAARDCTVGGLVARLGGLALDAERRAALGERRHLWRSRRRASASLREL